MTPEDLIEVGLVTGYFARVGVAGIDLSKPLRVGDVIRIKGHTTDLEQIVTASRLNTNRWRRLKPETRLVTKRRIAAATATTSTK